MRAEKDHAEATGDAEEAMAEEVVGVVGMVEEEEEVTAEEAGTEAAEDTAATETEIAIAATTETGVQSPLKKDRKSMLR